MWDECMVEGRGGGVTFRSMVIDQNLTLQECLIKLERGRMKECVLINILYNGSFGDLLLCLFPLHHTTLKSDLLITSAGEDMAT